MRTIILAGLILISMLYSPAWGNLTGRWSCNDGGTYYLRQTGKKIHWYGEAADVGPAWSNVFSGQIHEGRVTGMWIDVPKGQTAASGNLELAVEKNGTLLRVVSKSGGFDGTRWTRQTADTAIDRPLSPMRPSADMDCIRFNPSTVSIRQMNERWKVIDGDHWLFDFGPDKAAAHRALKVIRHYRIDRSCFIGWPNPTFSYMLAKGGSPTGAMAGENCVAFDPKGLNVSNVQGRWKIVSGHRLLFDFGRNETDARKTIAAIRRYGFSQSCGVGRPGADFTYLRR